MRNRPLTLLRFGGVLLLTLALSWWPEQVGAVEDFLVEGWNTDSGLPHSTVTSIVQTPDGYLWVGTLHGGLARFDGVRFVIFNARNTPELKSDKVQKLLVDSLGTLWVVMVDGQLVSYAGGRFHFERQNSQSPDKWLTGLISLRDNSLTFSSVGGELLCCQRQNGTNQWTSLRLTDANGLSSPCADQQGVIWYRTKDGQLGCIRNNSFFCFTNLPGLRNQKINALITDGNGRLWVGTDNELARWDGQKFENMTPTNGESNLLVRQITASGNGDIWLRTDNYLGKCRERAWLARVDQWERKVTPLPRPLSMFGDSRGGLWLVRYGSEPWYVDAGGKLARPQDNTLANRLVECWFEDREGNVWIGLTGGGLARLRLRTFHTVWSPNGEGDKASSSICEDVEGKMWFGTANGNLLGWQDEIFTNFPLVIKDKVWREVTLASDTAGKLWVGDTKCGIAALENGEYKQPFYSSDADLSGRVIYVDRADRVWIGNESGLFCWEQGKLKSYNTNDGFPSVLVSAITEDKMGTLWIGTALGELWRYQAGKFSMFRPLDNPSDVEMFVTAAGGPLQSRNMLGLIAGGEYFFRTLCADEEGVIWIGTQGGGLLRFQAGRFTRYMPHDGLPNEYVSQILEDKHGRLWLGTRSGISRASREALNAFARGAARFVPFVTYGTADGLPSAQCSANRHAACCRSRDGRLWFSTSKGAVWIDPDEVRLNSMPPSIVIEEVSANGQILPDWTGQQQSHLVISPGQHYLDFKFTALSLTSPDKVRFKWRLVGLEKEWSVESRRRSVSYGFVPPGDYEFQVLGCNNDGVWSPVGARVKFTVQAYFWQQWWFKTMAGFGGVTLIGLIYLARIARLQELERLRLRIARDLHDEVGANLGTISLLAQIVEKQSANPKVTQMRDVVVETIDTLRDIVWFIDPQHDRLSDLVTRLAETTKKMLPHINCKFEQTGNFQSARLSLLFRHNILPIYKEALHNLINHAHATEVRITVRRWENQFQFQIADNGAGFYEPDVYLGNGLKNMRRRAADIGGRLEIASQPGGGTTVILTAPITQTRNRLWWGIPLN